MHGRNGCGYETVVSGLDHTDALWDSEEYAVELFQLRWCSEDGSRCSEA